jgi:hypothetical protein
VIRIDLDRVRRALSADRQSEAAATTSGWDQSFKG